MKPTAYQEKVLQHVGQGESLILVAPTGLGKTFAATGDVKNHFQKVIYAVPLRALGNDVQRSILEYKRNGQSITSVIHHGGIQGSFLFGEEFIITTYDQVVCGAPGLPLSLPLKAGHAVAGALLMSRLIFDEAHLAWGISEQALSILLAIVQFRRSFSLQTVLMTATLPDAVSELLSRRLKIERVLVGEGGEIEQDEALNERDNNRQVTPELRELKKDKQEKLNFEPLDELLKQEGQGKRIYFANTVNRIQETFDRLIESGTNANRISVLHNRMPHAWRAEIEREVKARFGKQSDDGDWILLTNQVAEAGLDISASLVITDPAPVDTLVQRAGRCARWFRGGVTKGCFIVLNIPGLIAKTPSQIAKDYVLPYRLHLVSPAIKSFPTPGQLLSWKTERDWVNAAWGGGEREALVAVDRALNDTTFALNLFDRAAQERQPGQIARVFREVLSIEVAVEEGSSVRLDDLADRDLPAILNEGKLPDTSSISLGRAYALMNDTAGRTAVIRYDREENQLQVRTPDTMQLGDILILPSSMAYLHRKKGLCFDGERDDAILCSEWVARSKVQDMCSSGLKHRQTLSKHTRMVMDGSYARLSEEGNLYRKALINILRKLEPTKDEQQINDLANLVANLARVAAAFHDFGKADVHWQRKIRKLDPACPPGLVGRSLNTGGRIGIPHTPPGYVATVEACRMLLGYSKDTPNPLDPLIRAVALATCRHHSSLLNPARVENYKFEPHSETADFVREILSHVGASQEVVNRAEDIIEAAKTPPSFDDVPLMLPNEDLFTIYALVGRAILIADREDASGIELEQLG
jgi:CRISPR-associated helicase Cas3